jgi:hypothetical protein
VSDGKTSGKWDVEIVCGPVVAGLQTGDIIEIDLWRRPWWAFWRRRPKPKTFLVGWTTSSGTFGE